MAPPKVPKKTRTALQHAMEDAAFGNTLYVDEAVAVALRFLAQALAQPSPPSPAPR